MMPSLKTLGLTLMAAAFALSGVGASLASAETAHFTVEGVGPGETAGLSGSPIGVVNTYLVNGVAITCKRDSLQGKALSTGPEPSTITLEPTYEGCHMVIAGLTKIVTFTTNGCAYLYQVTKNTNSAPFSADLTIECNEAGPKQIEVHVYLAAGNENTILCTFDLTPHTALTGTIELTNEPATSPGDIIEHINVSTPLHSTFASGLCGPNETANWAFQNTFTLRGLKGATPVSMTVS